MALGWVNASLLSLIVVKRLYRHKVLASTGRREAPHQLIDPLGLGGFGVLVQSKGLTEAQTAQPSERLSLPPA